MSEIMIKAENLCKYYGSFTAVEGISFEVPRGQVVAFLGPNGAGKSTTMKLLTGFVSPSKGQAALAGIDVHQNRLKAAEKLGYLPENGPLYLDMTPKEALKFTAEMHGLKATNLTTALERVVKICDLAQVIDKPIAKLSKGYRQRVGMAQALIHDPEVIILDEPTSGLDPNQIRTVRQTIRELAKTKTIMLSTHILQEVSAMADRVIFINEGRLIFDGSVDEFKSKSEHLDDTFFELTKGQES
jgi:ABC-2 type transport system ATP-binding protein